MAASSSSFLTTSLSKKRVLVVGDGNFSFSLSLAEYSVYLECETSLVLTSFDSNEKLMQDEVASENLTKLSKIKNVLVLHDIDATKLSQHFSGQKFGRIIFNFPHTGGKSNIKKCRDLLKDFFLSAVKHLDDCESDICVTLCKGQGGTPHDHPYRSHGNSWQIVNNAANAGLILHQLLPFVTSDYCYYKSVGYRSRLKNGFNTDGGLIHIFIPGVKIGPVKDLRDSSPRVILDYVLEHVKEMMPKAMHDLPGHPVQILKDEIHHMLEAVADKLQLSFETFDSDQSFCVGDYLTNDFSRPIYSANGKCLQSTILLSSKILSAFKNCNSLFVYRQSLLTIPEEVSPTSNICTNCLVIGRSFESDEDCVFPKAEAEIRAVLDCLKTLLSPNDDSKLIEPNPLDIVVGKNNLKSKWTNSSEVAHLAKRKFHINTEEEMKCSSLHQNNIVCNCQELYQRFLAKDSRLNLQQCFLPEIVVPETFQVFKYLSTVIFESGHVSANTLKRAGVNKCGWLVKVDLCALATIRYGLKDIRLLWSDTVKMKQLSGEKRKLGGLVDVPRFISEPHSLFPASYVHDISFWVSNDVSHELFMLVMFGLTRNCVKEAKLLEIYHDENRHWLSFNYRMVYSRADGPLSHLEAVELQNILRRALLVLGFGLK